MSVQPAGDSTDSTGSDENYLQISLIVPTRNEAGNIRPLLERLGEALEGYQIEIIFVDDSTDDTPQTVRSLIDAYPFSIRLLARSPQNQNGLSGAVVDGFAMARGDWVCVMDADLQHPPETIPLMWEQAQKSAADMVVGSRRGDRFGPFGLTRFRAFNSKALTILARMLFPRLLKNVSDPLTGLFLLRRSAVDVSTLRPDGFKILLEILVRSPALHVTEVHFDFATRNMGESKADFREGIRFFRHLIRLRLTVNPHFYRFLIVITLGFFFNSFLLFILHQQERLTIWASTILAAEFYGLWIFSLFTFWVFKDREKRNLIRSFLGDLFLTQIFLLLIHIPVMWFLMVTGFLDYLMANMVALAVVSLVRYSLSEHWIWTRGGIAWQRVVYYYNIHDILTIESHIPFEELSFFARESLADRADIQIRLDRHGTPSPLPGGISYDEHLGRFGFGLSVLTGDMTQVVGSPLLGRSPNFFYTNIVEPILRWSLIRKGYAFVRGSAAASGKNGLLINSSLDMGRLMSELCTRFDFEFLADELSIVDGNGRVFAYPKPVTIIRGMLPGSASKEDRPSRLIVGLRRLVYSRFLRRFGLWLSTHNLPAASLNTYLQWLIPQPKFLLGDIMPELRYGRQASIRQIVWINTPGTYESILPEEKLSLLQQETQPAGFQPLPLLADGLRHWDGEDLVQAEKSIIINAFQTAVAREFLVNEGYFTSTLIGEIAQGVELDSSNDQDYYLKSGSHGAPEIL